MSVSTLSSARAVWLGMCALIVTVTLVAMSRSYGGQNWEQPNLLFVVVTAAASACVVAATIVMIIADRREMAEIGLLGSALMAASVLPLVHGMVTPGVLFHETEAFRAAAFLSLPVAVLAGLPLLLPHSQFGRWAARRWRDWTLLSVLGVFVLSAVLVFFPDAIAAPGPTDPLSVVVAITMILALGSISLRQLRFYELGHQRANLVASISIALLGATALLPLSTRPYSPGFWWLHLAGVLGVFGSCVGVAVSKGMSRSVQEMLAPVLLRDPLAAFELGLSPIVHHFVADLELKDQMTRDHVVRTAELAMRVGERFRMSGPQLRQLGLAAILHDVGKIRVPDQILKKPSSLTAAEYEIIKLHATDGEQMLAAEPTLAAAAPIVRSHHERMDGAGYPDGLVGHQIPLASRIIAACDALDAMTHDRQFRNAMSIELAFAILREHSGSQWDSAVVAEVIAVLPTIPTVAAFGEVGRQAVNDDEFEHLTSADIDALLASVDIEV